MIYFMQPETGGPVKIGCAVHVGRRHRQLELLYKQDLVVLATMDGGVDEEREIHERFSHLRLGRTEQFRPALELMAFIGRPLLVHPNPDAVEAMTPPPDDRVVIVHLKGSPEYAAWLEEVHRDTHITKAMLFRLGMQCWAKHNGRKPPPEF